MNNDITKEPINLTIPLCGLGDDYQVEPEPEYVWLANCRNADGYKSNDQAFVFPTQPDAEEAQKKAVKGRTYLANGPVTKDALCSVLARFRLKGTRFVHLCEGSFAIIRTWTT